MPLPARQWQRPQQPLPKQLPRLLWQLLLPAVSAALHLLLSYQRTE